MNAFAARLAEAGAEIEAELGAPFGPKARESEPAVPARLLEAMRCGAPGGVRGGAAELAAVRPVRVVVTEIAQRSGRRGSRTPDRFGQPGRAVVGVADDDLHTSRRIDHTIRAIRSRSAGVRGAGSCE